MKKPLLFLTLAALLLTALPAPALTPSSVPYPVCGVPDCQRAVFHAHDSHIYAGHYMGDGHDTHRPCPVQDCPETDAHDHGGVLCMPHHEADGHAYHHAEPAHTGEPSHKSRSGHHGGGHH